jgi:hypothetical protein
VDAAIGFINSVSEIAEEANHHPDLHLTGYRYASIDESDVHVMFTVLSRLAHCCAARVTCRNIEVIMQTHVIGGYARPHPNSMLERKGDGSAHGLTWHPLV